MTVLSLCRAPGGPAGIFSALVRDGAGNVLPLAAAAVFPLLALVGGGVDMGRGYLSQSRLQQACDAGVLAARKRLGTEAAVSGEIPPDVAAAGARFFNLNFRSGSYGSEDRTFDMALEDDFSISGRATVEVQTTLMAIFGFENMPVSVACEAQLNMANTDVMMVLDVTGSMAQTNPGDSMPRIDAMRETVRGFYAQLVGNAPSTTRLRFGFVPYSTNVNVGHLLQNGWVKSDWSYQSRQLQPRPGELSTRSYNRNWVHVSGTVGETVEVSSYAATYHPATAGYTYVDANERVVTVPAKPESYSCDGMRPANTYTLQDEEIGRSSEPFAGPPAGTRQIVAYRRVENGTAYSVSRSGTTCKVTSQTYNAYTRTFERVTDPYQPTINEWLYDQLPRNVSNWRTESNGCIEERATYEIDDYANVDLTRALDLNIDLVPTSAPATQWAPAYPNIIYARSMRYNGTGSFTPAQQLTTADFVAPTTLGAAACPAPARGLATISQSELDAYLGTLQPTGATYHDIGMIWGGRLLSPTGLFAATNADVSSTRPSTRHLIFLTDGQTEPRDISYSSYGLEPLDRRRWQPGSPLTLTQTVEKRFSFACQEVRKKNITVWVIGFGTATNPIMQECAGADRYFVADDAEELQETFATIAKRMGELRVSR